MRASRFTEEQIIGILREGFAELRRAFPDMPEFKVQVVQEWSGVVN